MTIRTLIPSDLPLLPALWNRAFPFDPVSKDRFYRNIVYDPNFSPDGVFLAEDNGRVCGFLSTAIRRVPVRAGIPIERDTGYITAFALEDEDLVGTCGAALLTAAEHYLAEAGKTSVTTGYFPLYLTQGVESDSAAAYAALYAKHGYTGTPSVALRMNLADYRPDEKTLSEKRAALAADGFLIGALHDEEILDLLDPSVPFSSPSWAQEFQNRLYDGDLSRFRVCRKDGKLVGACVFGDPNSDGERFGPFGTSPSCRGKGIGGLLLADCLGEMKARKLSSAWMQWVSPSGPAFHLYEKVGFTVEKRYTTFTKTFTKEA